MLLFSIPPTPGRETVQMGRGSLDSTGDTQSAHDPVQTQELLTLAMLPGIGPRTLTSLLEKFGDAGRVLAASSSQLASIRGVGSKLVHTIQTAQHHCDASSVVAWCEQNGVRILTQTCHAYPDPLNELSDAPPILFLRGTWAMEDELAVAIVGTRHATPYGLQQASRFGYALAKAGVTIVSGLARGIDAAAHQGAIDANGRTIAVLGSGLANIYPREHSPLADSIAKRGGVLSEYSPFAKPKGGMFPQRNRLISGMTLGTLVIEAPDRSGALITARLAGEQNREVFALPGPITSRASRGCNQLIRDGAKLVQTVDDILEELGPTRDPIELSDGRQLRNASELTLNEVEQIVLKAIGTESTLIDQVIEASELPAQRVIAVISVLEMRRLVRRLSGQYVSRI
ncbi:MAG: DNA-processing protein DprA [Rubripirellula sp.]